MESGNKKKLIARKVKSKKKGTLIIIGGKEDKSGDMHILTEFAQLIGKKKMVIVTIASAMPNDIWDDYKKIFFSMGLKNLAHFSVEQHEEAKQPHQLKIFENTHAVFFTGGDQLKITTKIGGTPVFDRILEIFKQGGIIAGTSAGAASMGKNMLIGGESSESHKVGNWKMAPGLGFIEDIIIDQHFAQRGRIGRLLGAVALNPGILGIGIDEDTAIVISNNDFKVIGTNAVYIIDGRDVSTTNISEAAAENTMSMHDVRLHILAHGEKFNLKNRKPSR